MFKKAVRQQAFLRVALMGPAGSGKTYSSLLLARHLGAKKIAVIDSERGSAKLYSDVADFDVCELESFAVERYMDAIAFAQREGYDCLIIDSLSHAWAGKDGILEYKDKRTEASRSRDSFGAGWRDASPLHTKFVDAILAFKGHVICTLRTKTEYVLEDGPNGKKVPRKIGMAPVQRDGVEYEFTVVGDFVDANKLAITKTRCPDLNDAVYVKPGREMAETLLRWLGSAEAAPAEVDPTAPAQTPIDTALAKTIARYPQHEAEARKIASTGDLAQLAEACKRWGASAKPAPATVAPPAPDPEVTRLAARVDQVARAIAKDYPERRVALNATVEQALGGRERLTDLSVAALLELQSILEGDYAEATNAACSPEVAA